jgi:hypothetical protein
VRDTIAVGRLRLRVGERGQASRAEHLIRDALRVASFTGVPAGSLVAVRRLDLGPVDLGEPSQAVALRIERAFRALRAKAVHAMAAAAPDADVVWARDRVAAAVAAAATVAAASPRADSWFWPRLLPGFRAGPDPATALASIVSCIAATSPSPAAALSVLLTAAPTAVRRELFAATSLLPSGLWDGQGALPPAPLVRLPDAVADELSQLARDLAPDDPRVALLAALTSPSPPSARGPAHRAQRRVPPPPAPLPRDEPAAGIEAAPAGRRHEPVTARERLRLPPASADAAPPAGLETPGPHDGHAPSLAFRGPFSHFAGAVHLVALVERVRLPATACVHAAFAVQLLARRAGAAADDAALAWLPAAEASPAAISLAIAALRWLRAADRRWQPQRHERLTLRRLVRRHGHVLATATHVDFSFALADADVRVRRIGLDLDPGWVPWLGRSVRIHFGAGAGEGRR